MAVDPQLWFRKYQGGLKIKVRYLCSEEIKL